MGTGQSFHSKAAFIFRYSDLRLSEGFIPSVSHKVRTVCREEDYRFLSQLVSCSLCPAWGTISTFPCIAKRSFRAVASSF